MAIQREFTCKRRDESAEGEGEEALSRTVIAGERTEFPGRQGEVQGTC
jgi:hypothetical protein